MWLDDDMFFGTFHLVQIIWVIAAVAMLGYALVWLIRGCVIWMRNAASPEEAVEAVLVAKRINVSSDGPMWPKNAAGTHALPRHSNTWYYATFELADGSRMELSVSGRMYGLMAEGDRGILRYQGTRFLGFDRRNDAAG